MGRNIKGRSAPVIFSAKCGRKIEIEQVSTRSETTEKPLDNLDFS